MVLALKSPTVSVAFGVASFFMRDAEGIIRVDVSGDLLAQLADRQVAFSKRTLSELLIRYRQRLAQIAAAKFDEGHYVQEVNVLVVRLELDDLAN